MGLGDIRGFSGLTQGKLPLGRQINPYGGDVSPASKQQRSAKPGEGGQRLSNGGEVDGGEMRGRERGGCTGLTRAYNYEKKNVAGGGKYGWMVWRMGQSATASIRGLFV